MIEVRHLTKRYGGHTAVSDLSFRIKKGQIYGFLGPNGAGKSTTMNIITGCMGTTEGKVMVAGHSVLEEPMLAKAHIGYLPEQPPLYMDMTPEEYLHFVAKAKGVSRLEHDGQVFYVMEKTGILPVRSRLIRNLSKGFRQRVGIAQALLGNPEVIILDEPTVGLDPAQIIEIRELIRELGNSHTVILSSHILSEVQAVCDHILILSGGKLVASDTPENLTSLFAGRKIVHLEAKGSEESVRQVLQQIQDIEEFTVNPGTEETVLITIKAGKNSDIREALFTGFSTGKLPLLEMRTEKASLEDVFLELTLGDSQSGLQDANADKQRESNEKKEDDNHDRHMA